MMNTEILAVSKIIKYIMTYTSYSYNICILTMI